MHSLQFYIGSQFINKELKAFKAIASLNDDHFSFFFFRKREKLATKINGEHIQTIKQAMKYAVCLS